MRPSCGDLKGFPPYHPAGVGLGYNNRETVIIHTYDERSCCPGNKRRPSGSFRLVYSRISP